MAHTAKALREDRGPVAAEIKRMAELANEEQRDFTAEELPTWDKLNADYDRLSRAIELAERAETVSAVEEVRDEQRQEERRTPGRENVNHRPEEREERRDDKTPTEEHRALALQAWLRAGAGKDLDARHMDAVNKCGIRPHSPELEFQFRRDYGKVRSEHRALSSITGTAGAYTVPEGFVNSLEMAMLEFGGMRQVASVIRTASGNDLPWPTTNDTSNKGALIGENVAVSEQDITFGVVTLHAYKYSSKAVKVPVELLEDSAFDLASEIGRMLGERIARITNEHFTTGDGASKPKGIVTASTLGVTAASATAITADEIIDLIHSVDPAYRTGAGFMFSDATLKLIRKLKTGDGQYLWQPGMQSGSPDMIYGYRYTINQDMATPASATKSVVFGQLSKYKIRDVASFRMTRLNERYADNDQVGFLAWSRHDGNLLDAGVAPVKHLLQAT